MLGIFRDVYTNNVIMKQIMSAAVASGIASTFGAPIGGVLFSIEVTASFYMVSNMWKGLFCALWCSILYNFLSMFEITYLV